MAACPENQIAGRRRAFTLVEAMIASAVLAVAALAVALSISAGAAQNAYALHAQRATELADELMERIMALPYDDPGGNQTPGPEIGESTPAQFDNADDYHGYSQAAGQIKDLAGALYPNTYQGFTRSVTAQYGSQTVTGLGTLNGLNVTVTVQDNQGDVWTTTRFIPQPAP